MTIDIKDINQAFIDKKYNEVISLCNEYEKNGFNQNNPNLPIVIANIKGISYLNLEKYSESENTFLESLKVNENNPETLYNLANLYFKINDFKKSLYSLEKIIKFHPYFLNAYHLIFKLKNYIEDYQLIENLLIKITVLDIKRFDLNEILKFINFLAKNYELYISKFLSEKILYLNNHINFFLYGLIQKKLNNFDLALEYLLKAHHLNKNSTLYITEVASVYEVLGDFVNSKKYLKKSIEIEPFSGSSYRSLSDIKSLDENDVTNIQNKIKESKDQNFLMHSYYALSNYYFNLNNHEEAFLNFNKANTIRLKDIKFDKEKYKNISTFYKDSIFNYLKNSKLNLPKNKNEIIFLVGMPRSGSTLLEQILNSHSSIKGYGEIDVLQKILEKKIYKPDIKKVLIKDKFSQPLADSIKIDYFDYFQNVSNDNEKYFIDKMLFNFFYIGLISNVFPNSKIILCKRDLKDIFISIIRNYFGSSGFSFAYSEDDIIEFMNIYANHINFWIKKNTHNMLVVDYEKLVNKPLDTCEQLFQFLNINFEANCLEFYKNKSAVSTASSFQVRSPIHNKSVNLWSNYQKFYRSAFEKLDKLNNLIY